MIINCLQFLAGAIFLYYGAELLIYGSKSIAAKFNIPTLVIGITIVALGTSLPELIVSIIANLTGEPGIAIGNVMGSNVANIALVLGVTVILSPIYFPFATIRYDLYFLILITCLPLWFIYIGGLVFWQGVVLILLLIIYCIYLMKTSKLDDTGNNSTENKNSFLLLIKIMIGIIGLAVGSILFVQGAKGIAIALGVSSLVIGMSIVALGTSLPELAASLAAAKHGETGMVLGNIIGSNIMNIVLVLGSTILFRNIPISLNEIIIQGIFMIILTIFLFFLIKWKGRITALSGIILLSIYFIFIFCNF